MDITYLGHSMFKLRGGHATVLIDPYDPNMVGLSYPKVSADIVTISHHHHDHDFSQRASDVKKIIDSPGEYEIAGVSIIGISSFHDSKKGMIRGKNTIFVYEIDNLRIVHLGDLGHKLSEDESGQLGTVDVLMIPCGGEYTIGPSEAAETARLIEPTITIPMHFKTPEISQETFGMLSSVDDFLKELGLPIEKLDKLSIKKETTSEERKVVVLERKS